MGSLNYEETSEKKTEVEYLKAKRSIDRIFTIFCILTTNDVRCLDAHLTLYALRYGKRLLAV